MVALNDLVPYGEVNIFFLHHSKCTMFDTGLFNSWLAIFSGAFLFALLFITVGIMSEYAIEGVVQVTHQALGLSGLAFTGYIWVALYLRSKDQK